MKILLKNIHIVFWAGKATFTLFSSKISHKSQNLIAGLNANNANNQIILKIYLFLNSNQISFQSKRLQYN